VAVGVIALGTFLTTRDKAPAMAPLLPDESVLPPLKDRLPEEPLVVQPYESLGRRGGTWNRAGASGWQTGLERILHEPLVKWDRMAERIRPNLAASWEMREDGRVWIIRLRKGVKWSDGFPLTSDDLVTVYEDITLNEELRAQSHGYVRDGEPVVIKALDRYTVEVTFAKPHPAFLMDLAMGTPIHLGPMPRHFIKTFHPAYVAESELKAMTAAAGRDNWTELFVYMLAWGENPNPREIPTLSAWIPVTSGAEIQRHLCVRNPYYWKVDPNGVQLPYIDVVAHDIVTSPEVMNLMIMSGQVDMQFRDVRFADYSLLARYAGKGGYRLVKWRLAVSSQPVLTFNHNNPEPFVRELFNNRRFKEALSIAIHRNEINELVFYGAGKPWQAGVISASPFFDQKFLRHLEFDPERANRLLDDIGLARRDERGFRLRPDGSPLRFLVTHSAVADITALELIQGHWANVGIEVRLHSKPMRYSDILDAKYDIIYGDQMDRGMRPDMDPMHLAPIAPHCKMAPKYGKWWADQEAGRETPGGEPPPEGSDFAECLRLVDELGKTAYDDPRRIEIMKAILDLNSRNLWSIGIIGELPAIGIVKTNFHNVPDEAVSDWLIRTPSNTDPEQYWIDL
jgi:peptide/nickel transport system substrate-binding protein